MHARKRMTLRLGLARGASLLPWNLPQASAFSPNNDGSAMGGSGSPTAQKVSGKAVKINRGILGKNRLYLQDGTGNQAAETNDLVVTTDSLPEVGEVVTITGNISRNRDFGAGYRYGVIIENAEVIGRK